MGQDYASLCFTDWLSKVGVHRCAPVLHDKLFVKRIKNYYFRQNNTYIILPRTKANFLKISVTYLRIG